MSGTPGAPSPGSDADAWQILSPLMARGGYLPWTSGSMRPAALVEVCNETVHGDRTRIVECGAGVSTVLLARLLRNRGVGTITSIEHDEHWAALITAQLHREALDATARVVHAPLGAEPAWYQLDESTDPVDLLVIDGPPAFDSGHEARRAPALQHFEKQLVPGAVVILDDLDRPGEQQVVASWEASTRWRFEINQAVGIALGRRSA
jgi:predicted O-methyltransferase YrrM